MEASPGLTFTTIVVHRGHEHAGQSATLGYQEVTLVLAVLVSVGLIAWYAYSVFA